LPDGLSTAAAARGRPPGDVPPVLAGHGHGGRPLASRSTPGQHCWRTPAMAQAVPGELGGVMTPARQLHVICDNYATHKHRDVKDWLAKNPRVTLHFTPTGCSWLNLVECFFSIITRQAIRRGSFTSVKQLVATIGAFIDHWNDHPRPFTWTKDADEILASIQRAKTKANALTEH